jgi:hypothetical protein
MIPTKRSSPFTRARTFHGNQARKEQGEDADMEGSPFKRHSFARTLSTPFQVLNPSLKNIRNPFEKLALGPRAEESPSGSALDRASQDIKEEGFEVLGHVLASNATFATKNLTVDPLEMI